MQFLNERIKHVIYVVKENRTFDQVLGDLTNGAKVDPSLTQFGAGPHAEQPQAWRTEFVTLDNFMNPGDGSMDGWSWTMQGRVTKTGDDHAADQLRRREPRPLLRVRGHQSQRAGQLGDRGPARRGGRAGRARPTTATRSASLPGGTANLLTGSAQPRVDRRAVRHRGRLHLQRGAERRQDGPQLRLPREQHRQHRHDRRAGDAIRSRPAIIQVAPLDPALAPLTDVYFRGYDQNYPDLWRYNEWKREFDQFVANGNLPSLSLVRISHDHMGSFGTALGGVNTPETQQADCDLALGLMIEAVANSRYADDTLIVVDRRRRAGWPGPRGLASRDGLLRRPVREAGRGREHALQPGQRCSARSRTSSARSTST